MSFSIRRAGREAAADLPWGTLALFFLLLSASLLLLYLRTSVAELHALRHTLYARNELPGFQLAVTPERYTLLRLGLGAVVLASGAGLLIGWRQWEAEWQALRQQATAIGRAVGAAIREMSGAERVLAGALLLSLAGARLYYYHAYPLGTDEVATYDYFVRPGPVAATSFYPIPNNHILFSLLSQLVNAFTDYDRLVVRLPTLLLGLAGTALAYAVLLRAAGFRAATLAVALFGFSPLGLYYAVAGRGYFLLVLLALGQFLAALLVLYRPAARRLGWGGFILTGILGVYTIPTYAYPLASLLLWLGGVLAVRESGRGVLTLALAAGLIGLGGLMAYAPVICVSGLASLTDNPYIAPQTSAEFWHSYADFLRQPARELFGHETLGRPFFVVIIGLSLAAWRWLDRAGRRLAGPALVLAVSPFLFMPLQLVYSPARVLLYAAFFFFLLAGLLGAELLNRLRVSGGRGVLVLALFTAAYGFYQMAHLRYQVRAAHRSSNQLTRSYAWLRARQPGRVFFAAPFHQLYFHHYATTSGYPLRLLDSTSAPISATRFPYVVRAHDQPAPPWLMPAAYRPVYTDEWATIYQLVPERRPVLRPPAGAGK